MPDATVVQWLREKYLPLSEVLNECSRRVWAATEARSLGRGGIAAVLAATGMSSAPVYTRGFVNWKLRRPVRTSFRLNVFATRAAAANVPMTVSRG